MALIIELLNDMRRERDMWKRNHDVMVGRNALLRQRPDLPLDRIPAGKKLAELSEMVDTLLEAYDKEYLLLTRPDVRLVFSDVKRRKEALWN